MFDNSIEIGHEVLDKCSKKGMEKAEIFIAYNNVKQVTINGRSISTQRAKEEIGAGIRVIHKNAVGFSYTNILTRDALEKCADEAFSIAKNSATIEGIGLASKQKYSSVDGLYNQEIVNLSVEDITQDALDYIAGFTGIDDRVATVLSNISANVSGNAVINTNGVEAQYKTAYYQASLMALASEQGRSGAYVFDTIFSRKHDANLKTVGEQLGKKAIDNLNQKTIKAFDGEVIFRENAMLNPVVLTIAFALSGENQQKGSSFWKDKLADKVASEHFTMIDKPHNIQGATGVKPFDDEGNATRQLELIKDGVLQMFVHNQKTANKENLEPTGNAVRSLGGGMPKFAVPPTSIFPNSPWVQPGDMTEEELIEDTKKGIILHNYQGTLRNENGLFSGVAKGAYLIEDGEIKYPVTGVSIAGNVFEIINNITGIGNELHLAAVVRTPLIRYKGIKISTK
ncbi:MAG: hypothetical protein GF308_03480 [Candidatus Heimdallarchaeota archaeon]|nr:hypothetical protein [Candidatus Heimdallarchaeota archaeon]